jgi:hypothetical protein
MCVGGFLAGYGICRAGGPGRIVDVPKRTRMAPYSRQAVSATQAPFMILRSPRGAMMIEAQLNSPRARLLQLAQEADSSFTGPRDTLVKVERLRPACPKRSKIRVARIEQIVPLFRHNRRRYLQYGRLAALQPLATESL